MSKIVILILFTVMPFATIRAQTASSNSSFSKDYSESSPYKPSELPDKKSKKVKKPKATEAAAARLLESDKSVTIPVSVINSRGNILTSLTKSDFKVFADDREIEDFSLESKSESLNIILLIDTSPSTDFQIEEIQNFALRFVETLKPQDKVLVAEFNNKLKIRTEMTDDRQIISKAIDKTKFDNGTALYDSIQDIFKNNTGNGAERTALVLITDGVDTTSMKSGYEKSLLEAGNNNLPVFIVYINTFEPKSSKYLSPPMKNSSQQPPLGTNAADYELGKQYLNDLIALSGGRVILFEKALSPQQKDATSFAEELRHKYYLKFTPPSTEQAGERKQLKIRVNRPNLIVLAKGSFITK